MYVGIRARWLEIWHGTVVGLIEARRKATELADILPRLEELETKRDAGAVAGDCLRRKGRTTTDVDTQQHIARRQSGDGLQSAENPIETSATSIKAMAEKKGHSANYAKTHILQRLQIRRSRNTIHGTIHHAIHRAHRQVGKLVLGRRNVRGGGRRKSAEMISAKTLAVS